MSCNHDKLKLPLFFNCCNKYYNCYYCHNTNNNHIVKKKDILHMKCEDCNLIQNVSSECIKCKKKPAKYFCKICKFFSNKELNHCVDCNMCYEVSNKSRKIHCYDCNKCYSEKNYKNHKCNISKNQDECIICLENFKLNDNKYYILKCSHKIHINCFNNYKSYCYKNQKVLTCSLCRLSVNKKKDEERIDKIIRDDDILDIKTKILCYDCNQSSDVNFHHKYLKCLSCNSYNTVKNR